MTSTVLHIGYQKTASTTLQKEVFPNLPNSYDLRSHPAFRTFVRSIENDDDSEYPATRWRALFSELAQSGRPPILISRENFCQVPHWPRTADRLHALAPDARVLLIVRNQGTIMPSLHGQYLKGGGYLGFIEWVDSVRSADWLQYDQVVDRYDQLFGRESVRVMAFEQLRIDPAGFMNDICQFVAPGAPPVASRLPTVNPAISRPSRWVFRHANRLFRRSSHNDRPVIEVEPVWRALESACYHCDRLLLNHLFSRPSARDRAFLDRLLPTFGDGNARLAERTGLPLVAFQYPMPGRPLSSTS
jgi:hypothetical protein